jgi:hypothetical protein
MKAAHVCPFELVWKIHRHGQSRNRRLALILSIKNDNRILEIADANLIDCDLAVVGLILDISHQLSLRLARVDAT